MSNKDLIRRHILETYLFTDKDDTLADDDSLLDKGIIDSTGILGLVLFLEEQWGIVIEDEELLPDNLDSINRLVKFIEFKQG